jgi:F420-0:gamma-glutamyl ligase
MNVYAVKTKLMTVNDNLNDVISRSINSLEEKSVLVIASKVFSYSEGRLVERKTLSKDEKWDLARKEADLWLDPDESKYQCMLTIKGNWMFANAGIDESNAENGGFVLWPKDPQASVNSVWNFVREHYGVKEVGVIMSDSRALPLSWGVMGHAVASCGFEVLKSYIGKPDLFGRIMQMEQVNMAQSIVTAGTLEMGEGDECTPIAIVKEVKDMVFCDHVPSQNEIDETRVSIQDDIFAPLLTKVPWQKGEGGVI